MKNRVFIFALCLSAYYRKATTEVETVWLKDVTTRLHTDKHTLSDPDLPDQLSFHLKLKSHGVNLNLKRNYQTDPNVDVYTVEILKDGLPILKKTHDLEKEDVAYYQDIENGAFMTARCVKRSSGQCDILINGNIQIGDKMYDLQPSEAHVTSRNFMEITSLLGKQYVLQDQGSIQRKKSVENKEEGNVNEENVEEELIDWHRLIPNGQDKQKHFLHPGVKLKTRNAASVHNAFATGENNYSRTNSKNSKMVSHAIKWITSLNNDKIRNLREYYVEVVVLTDSSIFDLFVTMVASLNPSERVTVAKKRMKDYFLHVVNGVNMLYRGIQDSTIRIHVILRALVILETQSQFQHVLSSVVSHAGRNYIDAKKYLTDLGKWDINVGLNQLPAYDQIILFSHHVMHTGSFDCRLNGLSNIKRVCDVGKRVQLNRVGHYFLTVIIAAHELGHALGAEHDGEADATSCSPKDGYIMTPQFPKFQPNETYSRNPWLFSKCSVKAFTKTLQRKTCTISKGVYSQAILDECNTVMMKPPGELFTVDEQCHIMFGYGSKYCGWCNSEGLCVSKHSVLVHQCRTLSHVRK